MSTHQRLMRLLPLVALIVPALACQDTPTGPSLANMVISGLTWQPTMNIANADTVCCCHLRGLATNNNAVAVHATLTVRTFKQQAALPAMIYIMKDIPPGASRSFEVAGFIVPCAEITGWNYELEVKGITHPPI